MKRIHRHPSCPVQHLLASSSCCSLWLIQSYAYNMHEVRWRRSTSNSTNHINSCRCNDTGTTQHRHSAKARATPSTTSRSRFRSPMRRAATVTNACICTTPCICHVWFMLGHVQLSAVFGLTSSEFRLCDVARCLWRSACIWPWHHRDCRASPYPMTHMCMLHATLLLLFGRS